MNKLNSQKMKFKKMLVFDQEQGIICTDLGHFKVNFDTNEFTPVEVKTYDQLPPNRKQRPLPKSKGVKREKKGDKT